MGASLSDGTASTLIANGAKDVTGILVFIFGVVPSSGAANWNIGGLAPGESMNIYEDGSNIVVATVSAVGAFTVQRTGGTRTYEVIIPSAGWI